MKIHNHHIDTVPLGGSFAYTGVFESSTFSQATTAFGDALLSAGFGGTGTDEDQPFAYLNYILFNDDDMTSEDAGWARVPESAGYDLTQVVPHAKVAFEEPIVAKQSGYVYIWVSNESEGAEVWFDDLKVTHTQTVVTQVTDYGVWGDVLREMKAAEITYRHGYQGQFAEKDDETGWNHFELREYDPIIGRWTAMDPKRIGFSPYIGMYNQPTNGLDVDGGGPPTDYYNTGTGEKVHYDDGKNHVVMIEPEMWKSFLGQFGLVSDLNISANIGTQMLNRFGILYDLDEINAFYNDNHHPDKFEYGAYVLLHGQRVSLSKAWRGDGPKQTTFLPHENEKEAILIRAKAHNHYITGEVYEGPSFSSDNADTKQRGVNVYNIVVTPSNIYFYNKGTTSKSPRNGLDRWSPKGVDITVPRK